MAAAIEVKRTLSQVAWQNFLDAIKSDQTMTTYLSTMKRYFKREGVTQETCARLLKRDIKTLQQGVIDFLNRDMDGTAAATKRTAKSAIKNFYEMNDVVLNWKKIGKTIKGIATAEDRAYRREEVAKALGIASRRMKVAVLLMSSAGLRKGGLLGLKVKDLTKIEYYGIYAISVYSDDRQAKYLTFCTAECAQAIDDYLAYRRRCGEAVNEESPMIRNDFDIENRGDAIVARRLEDEGFDHAMKKLLVEAGLRTTKHTIAPQRMGSIRHDVKMAHGLRKFFYTSMVKAKVDALRREQLMGHKTGQQGGLVNTLELIYDRPEDNDLLKEYMKAINELTVAEERRLKRQLESKQKLDERTLKQTVAQMIEEYLQNREQLAVAHHSMTDEEFAEKIEQVEKLNPLHRLGMDGKDSVFHSLH